MDKGKLDSLERELALQNLTRLVQYDDLPRDVPKVEETLPSNFRLLSEDTSFLSTLQSLKEDYDILKLEKLLIKWKGEHPSAITDAIAEKVFTNGESVNVNFNIAFLPFLESMAVYMRDWGQLEEAKTLFKSYMTTSNKGQAKDAELHKEKALVHYRKAHERIKAFAASINLDFTMICDLVNSHPKRHPEFVGPFVGAFIHNSKQSPSIGLAFKGTNPLNIREAIVDYCYDHVQDVSDREPKLLNGKKVSRGVYTALFGSPEKVDDNSAYKMITKLLLDTSQSFFVTNGTFPRIHVTGHSLGGSFSQLFYSQLMLESSLEITLMRPFFVGDQFTFGAPRVGSKDWAIMVHDYQLQLGTKTHRFFNDNDLVPQVPPSFLKQERDFCHVGDPWKIFKEKKDPEAIEPLFGLDEIKAHILNDCADHCKRI